MVETGRPLAMPETGPAGVREEELFATVNAGIINKLDELKQDVAETQAELTDTKTEFKSIRMRDNLAKWHQIQLRIEKLESRLADKTAQLRHQQHLLAEARAQWIWEPASQRGLL